MMRDTLPPRMTLEAWLREDPAPPVPPTGLGLVNDSECVNPTFGTWKPGGIASWDNPGGLTAVRVQWYLDGAADGPERILALDATSDSYLQSSSDLTASAVVKFAVRFQNDVGIGDSSSLEATFTRDSVCG